MIRDLVYRIRALVRRTAMESELDEELRFHYERQVEKLLAAGVEVREARRQARLLVGGVEQVKEECREAWGVELVENAFRDVRYSLRVLRKAPAFTVVAALSVALGLGGGAAVFSGGASGVLGRPPFEGPGKLVARQRED